MKSEAPRASLPPRLESAVLAAAEHLTAIAHAEGIELGGKQGEVLPHLVAILELALYIVLFFTISTVVLFMPILSRMWSCF